MEIISAFIWEVQRKQKIILVRTAYLCPKCKSTGLSQSDWSHNPTYTDIHKRMRLFFVVQREMEWDYVTTIGDDADDVIPQMKIYI
jgi:hypothetical protein